MFCHLATDICGKGFAIDYGRCHFQNFLNVPSKGHKATLHRLQRGAVANLSCAVVRRRNRRQTWHCHNLTADNTTNQHPRWAHFTHGHRMLPVGAPRQFGSVVKLYCVFAIQTGKWPYPAASHSFNWLRIFASANTSSAR